jgi:hypothetical protein
MLLACNVLSKALTFILDLQLIKLKSELAKANFGKFSMALQ